MTAADDSRKSLHIHRFVGCNAGGWRTAVV
jgi:hypothetical protein